MHACERTVHLVHRAHVSVCGSVLALPLGSYKASKEAIPSSSESWCGFPSPLVLLPSCPLALD